MSNIYIQEPPTLGKVLLHTTAGDIDVELWSREAPRACKNFVQLCMEGYYNGTIFHRVVKGFIVQGGDPSGTGQGGESVYGAPFKDEFHTRLRFNRRGLLAMANAGKDDNGSQFFFTLGPAPELQNKHTIFGKISGDTVYNMLKLAEGLVDHDERPQYPYKILGTEVLSNPFPDIVPRTFPQSDSANDELGARKQKKKDKRAAVKDFKLLSFGSEAEDDEVECTEASRRLAAVRPSKSAHELLSDPSLSSTPAVPADDQLLSGDEDESIGPAIPIDTSNIRKKLQKKTSSENSMGINQRKHKLDESDKQQDHSESSIEHEEANSMQQSQADKLKLLREEYKTLRAQVRKAQNKDCNNDNKQIPDAENKILENVGSKALEQFEAEKAKYRTMQDQFPKKGTSREAFTMQLLAKFQKKLSCAKDSIEQNVDDNENNAKEKVDDQINEDSGWMTHKLQFDKGDPVLAKDASTKDDDWFEIYDPRNPINKRRRESGREQKTTQDFTKLKK